jgi:hypothetical protein
MNGTDAGLDFDATYAVAGYRGVAFRALGWDTEPGECEGHPADWDDPMGETVYCDGSCEPDPASTGMLRMRMVGDDHVFPIDPDDLTALDDDAYCDCCGQIGCGWGGGSE